MYSLDRTIDATIEPVSIARAKEHCRVEIDDDDDLLAGYITAARQFCEQVTGRALLSQTWRLSLPSFPWMGIDFAAGYSQARIQRPGAVPPWQAPEILLPRPKLIGIVSLTYLDGNGARQTLDPAQYLVNFDGEPASLSLLPGFAWPSALVRRGSVQVTYTAGYGSDPSSVPAPFLLAILMLVGHWYENREATVLPESGMGVVSVPLGVSDLLQAYTFDSFTLES